MSARPAPTGSYAAPGGAAGRRRPERVQWLRRRGWGYSTGPAPAHRARGRALRAGGDGFGQISLCCWVRLQVAGPTNSLAAAHASAHQQACPGTQWEVSQVSCSLVRLVRAVKACVSMPARPPCSAVQLLCQEAVTVAHTATAAAAKGLHQAHPPRASSTRCMQCTQATHPLLMPCVWVALPHLGDLPQGLGVTQFELLNLMQRAQRQGHSFSLRALGTEVVHPQQRSSVRSAVMCCRRTGGRAGWRARRMADKQAGTRADYDAPFLLPFTDGPCACVHPACASMCQHASRAGLARLTWMCDGTAARPESRRFSFCSCARLLQLGGRVSAESSAAALCASARAVRLVSMPMVSGAAAGRGESNRALQFTAPLDGPACQQF